MRVISFIGADSQVGTTMLAQALGESLATEGERVVTIFASGNYGSDFIRSSEDWKELSIDCLLDEKEGGMKKERILGLIQQNKGMGFIHGVSNIQNTPFFRLDTISRIKESLKGEVDYLIVDGGCNLNSPLTISALVGADKRFFVLTQQDKSLRKYKYMKKILLDNKGLKGDIILNMYRNEEGLYTREHLEFLLEEYACAIFSRRNQGWEKEMEKETLLTDQIFLEEMEAFKRVTLKRNRNNLVKEVSVYDEKSREMPRSKKRIFFK